MRIIVLLSLLYFPTLSFASDEGLYAFGGVGFGYADVAEDNTSLDRQGIHAEIKADVSYYKSSFIFDLGIGWFYNEVDNERVNTFTESTFFEGSLRYRFNPKWNFGPILMTAVDNDNTFEANVGINSTETFVGLRLDYEPDVFRTNKLRLNLTAYRDMTISERDVTLLLVGVQFGIPFWDREKKTKVVEKVIVKRKYIPRLIKLSENRMKATFDQDSGFYFATGSDEPNKEMVEYLDRLVFYLNKYSKEWEKVEVQGHTDDVGKLSYNMQLSKRRAEKIRSLMVEKGLDKKRTRIRWFGPKKPLINEKTAQARAKNRRVEIVFEGVQNMKSFFQGLSIIQ
jgi:outer membrane protein OmpA-like peptidoglycan-associated protein